MVLASDVNRAHLLLHVLEVHNVGDSAIAGEGFVYVEGFHDGLHVENGASERELEAGGN